MNRQKMLRQVQVLRRKRMARTTNTKPSLKDGIIKLDKPLPYSNTPLAPNEAEIRRKKAEHLLKQRKQMLKNSKRTGGCGGCSRKREQK